MTIKQTLDQDIKQAMLAGDKTLTTTLRGLKSAILYAEVAAGTRESGGLNDDEVVALFSKEAKKRQDSADLYKQGGNQEKAQAELDEKTIIEKYLPAQMSDEDLRAVVAEVIASTGVEGVQAMGKVIGAVRVKVGTQADGGRIAAAVKEQLQ